MSRYEIMLLVDGELSEGDARDRIKNLLSFFEALSNYKEYVIANDTLAYSIKKKTKAHRFVINFELEDSSVLVEFNRLALLNNSLLRYLVINESKDRSFRSRNNPKKIKDYEIRQEKFKAFLEFKKSSAINAS